MVVDDSEADRQIVRRALSTADSTIKIQFAPRARDAIALLQENSFDCVLLDYLLPDMNGLETLESLRRESLMDTAIIMLTGIDEEALALECLKHGAQDYLNKSSIASGGLLRAIDYARERKRIETNLRTSEQRIKSLIHKSPNAFISMDSDGIIHEWNEQAESIFGWAATEVIGKDLSDIIIRESERERHRSGLRHMVATGESKILNQSLELVALRRDGSEFPVEVHIWTIDAFPPYQFFSFIKDISDQKRIEQMKAEMASDIAHEFRTPLTSILGSLTLLVSGKLGEVPASIAKLLEVAERNAKGMLRYTNDFLEVSKMNSGKMTLSIAEYEVAALVQEAVQRIQGYAEHFGVTLTIEDQLLHSPPVRLDRDRFIQILSNLTSNAIKFSPKGEAVVIRIELVADAIIVSVIDRGMGIPKEHQAKLFERFEQGEQYDLRSTASTGLGLSICKKLSVQMGCELDFHSAAGVGSTFIITIPITKT